MRIVSPLKSLAVTLSDLECFRTQACSSVHMDLVRIGATWYAVHAPKQEGVFYAISRDHALHDNGKHSVLLSW